MFRVKKNLNISATYIQNVSFFPFVDGAEKTNGTAGTVEERSPST